MDVLKGLPTFTEMYEALKAKGGLGSALTAGIKGYDDQTKLNNESSAVELKREEVEGKRLDPKSAREALALSLGIPIDESTYKDREFVPQREVEKTAATRSQSLLFQDKANLINDNEKKDRALKLVLAKQNADNQLAIAMAHSASAEEIAKLQANTAAASQQLDAAKSAMKEDPSFWDNITSFVTGNPTTEDLGEKTVRKRLEATASGPSRPSLSPGIDEITLPSGIKVKVKR
jgi:hypothetical protein